MFGSDERVEGAPRGGSSAAHALGLLAEATAALATVEAGELLDPELSDLLVELDRCRNRLDAAVASVAGVWDGRVVWSGDGARSGAGWLASHTERSRPAAAGELKLARALRAMPATARAFATGELGGAKARLLAEAAAAAPEVFAEHEALLVEQAQLLRVDELARALDFWRARANPEDEADRAARQHDKRAVHLSRSFEGTWHLDGNLTSEGGEILDAALRRITDDLYKAQKAEADAAGGIVTVTAAQRRADALIILAQQGTAATDAGTPVNVPSITALVDLNRLTDPGTADTDPVGETTAGSPVAAETARRWSCDASIARIILGPDGSPLDLGEAARYPSAAMRRALVVRDRACVFPGCDQPVHRTHAHHIVHWTNGGPTDRDNLALLCSGHHHAVHEGGYGLTRTADGNLHFTRPDGTPLTVPKGTAPPPDRPWPHAA